MAEKLHDAVVKFDTYQNLQRHHAVFPAIAWHLVRDGDLMAENHNSLDPYHLTPWPGVKPFNFLHEMYLVKTSHGTIHQ